MDMNRIELEVQSPSTHAGTSSRVEADLERESNLGSGTAHGHEFSLAPVDRGRDAWMFLTAAFMVEVLVWGFPFAYGLFQEFYSSHEPFAGSKNIAVIGTCAMGVMYLSAPLVFGTLQRFPRLKRPAVVFGLITMCIGLGLSSLSQNVTHLIVTQGVFYAVGGGLVYSPTILFMDEWFVKKKGFAFGVMWAGTGLGGVLIPLLLQYLLNNYGFRTTLRCWSIILFLATAPLTYFLKPRLPISQTRNPRPWNLSFLFTPTFLLLQTGNILEGLGYFVPSIYLPTFARQLGASGEVSALTIILFNIASVFGCILMGLIIDRWHVTTCILLSTIGSTLSIFLIWGFSTCLPPLFIFSLLYGLFAGSFSSTWPGIMVAVKQHSGAADADSSMVFAMLAAGRGIGNVVCGPVSEALKTGGKWDAVGVYGDGYGTLVVFTGVSAALGGIGVLGRRVGWV
ncbi:MFS general substrate transporter [Lindgomyces ingoldianus]|uniref:MFS general substrate transporter n=1 Tax=Lindgomyces ingoldianus TaxID=673940 RepID=A0ACB6QBR7_9PLEO|nr:MFS general substrate transporter [Lindgomyces ingoldianus]KAF2463580.1 MFS general substrate transporter [Lindgomyces ingoldianus]